MAMSREEIRKAFDYPYAAVLDFALALVNLKEKERTAIKLSDIEGKGEERTAEIMDISVRAVSSLKSSGYKKIGIVWESNPLVRHMVETAERRE